MIETQIMMAEAHNRKAFREWRRAFAEPKAIPPMITMVLTITAIALASCQLRAEGPLFESKEPPFSMQLPDGFQSYPQGKNATNIICSYSLGTPVPGKYPVLVQVNNLYGTIGPEKPSANMAEMLNRQFPPGSTTAADPKHWRGFEG